MNHLVNTKKRLDQWQALLKSKKEKMLCEALQDAPIVEVADFLSQQPCEYCVRIMESFSISHRAQIFENFEENRQLEIYKLLTHYELASIFEYMSSDTRVDFYQKLTDDQKRTFLTYLPTDIRQDVINLSIYPSETAGAIMSTDLVTLTSELTVEQALDQVRKAALSNKMIYCAYIVDKENKMLGFVMLRDLVIANSTMLIASILHKKFVFAEAREDQESVARKVEKYNLMALPILNASGQLVGIVNYDDAMDVIRMEQTEDLERLMGIVPNDKKENYLAISSLEHFSKRIKWLTALFFVSFLSSFIMHRYESLLKHMGILTLYLTTVNDAGGNAGSQTATVVIRALSLGQVTLKSWIKILLKETKIALMFAFSLSILTFFKVIFFSKFLTSFIDGGFGLPREGIFYLSFVVAFSLSAQVIISTLIGAGLPMLIKWRQGDPALAASPAITTIVDSTGLLIYFTFSAYMFAL